MTYTSRCSDTGKMSVTESLAYPKCVWKYEGEFEDGQKNGFGSQTYPENHTRLSYTGQWKDDKPSGYGTVIYRDNSTHTGRWKIFLTGFCKKLHHYSLRLNY